MSFIKTLKVVFALMSVGLMAMGVCLMIWPGASVSAICVGLGVLAVVYGVVRMVGYFCNDLYRLAFQFDLAVGLLSILVGAVLLLHSDRVMAYLPILIGVFLLVDSVLRFQTAMDAKAFGMGKWWVILTAAILGAALGVWLLVRPGESAVDLVRLLGLALVIDGGENLLAGLYTVKTPRRSAAVVVEGEYTVLDGPDGPGRA